MKKTSPYLTTYVGNVTCVKFESDCLILLIDRDKQIGFKFGSDQVPITWIEEQVAKL